MAHLHQVVYFNPAADAGFADAGAVDARVRLDLDIVLDHDRRGLRDFVPRALAGFRETKTVGTDDYAVLQ